MSEATPSRPGADRNLQFGILALQMDFIGRDALIAAMHAPGRPTEGLPARGIGNLQSGTMFPIGGSSVPEYIRGGLKATG
jgi:hypothetical protein